jgi:hypothetical protein
VAYILSHQRRQQMTMTYKIAMAAGRDAGNKSAKASGRTSWNEDDFNAAAAVVAKLIGAE